MVAPCAAKLQLLGRPLNELSAGRSFAGAWPASGFLAGYHIVLSRPSSRRIHLSIPNLPVFPERDPLHLMIFHRREREESFSKLFITVLLSLGESAGAIEARSARPLPCWSTRRLLCAEWHRAHSGPLSPANSADFTCHVSVGLISVIIMRYHLRSALHDHDRRRHLSPPLVFRDRCDGRAVDPYNLEH